MTAVASASSRAGLRSHRLGWADVARGVAIIAVVYFHATLFLEVVGVDRTLGRAKALLELVPLPAFFLIAGLFSSRLVKEGSFRELTKKRVVPLLYVYVLWSLFRFAMFALFPSLPSRATDIAAGDPLSLLLLPVLPASLYWFLYALALSTLLTWILRRAPRWLLGSAAAAVSMLFTSGVVNTGTIAWNRIGTLFVFFVVGVLFRSEMIRLMTRARHWHAGVAVGIYLAIALALALARPLLTIPGTVFIGQVAGVAALLLVAKSVQDLRAARTLVRCGRASLAIYLSHILVIPPLAWLIGLFSPSWPTVVNILVAVAVTAVAVAVGLGLAAVAPRIPWLFSPPWTTARRRSRSVPITSPTQSALTSSRRAASKMRR